MYKLSTPFMLEQVDLYGTEPFICKLHEIGADMVFLALDCYHTDKKSSNRYLHP